MSKVCRRCAGCLKIRLKVFSDFLFSKANPPGEITEHVEKIEFQLRGSPHAHCLLWVKDAPRMDVNTEEEVCDFVDK